MTIKELVESVKQIKAEQSKDLQGVKSSDIYLAFNMYGYGEYSTIEPVEIEVDDGRDYYGAPYGHSEAAHIGYSIEDEEYLLYIDGFKYENGKAIFICDYDINYNTKENIQKLTPYTIDKLEQDIVKAKCKENAIVCIQNDTELVEIKKAQADIHESAGLKTKLAYSDIPVNVLSVYIADSYEDGIKPSDVYQKYYEDVEYDHLLELAYEKYYDQGYLTPPRDEWMGGDSYDD